MFGGTTFRREMIQREISRVLVLNLSGEAKRCLALLRISLPLTEPSLLSRRTPSSVVSAFKNRIVVLSDLMWPTRLNSSMGGSRSQRM